jgi:hypothetical protein
VLAWAMRSVWSSGRRSRRGIARCRSEPWRAGARSRPRPAEPARAPPPERSSALGSRVPLVGMTAPHQADRHARTARPGRASKASSGSRVAHRRMVPRCLGEARRR